MLSFVLFLVGALLLIAVARTAGWFLAAALLVGWLVLAD